jgi:hypothetical protein
VAATNSRASCSGWKLLRRMRFLGPLADAVGVQRDVTGQDRHLGLLDRPDERLAGLVRAMSLLQHAPEERGAGQEVQCLEHRGSEDVLEARSAVPVLADAPAGPRQLCQQTADGRVGRPSVHYCSGLALDA